MGRTLKRKLTNLEKYGLIGIAVAISLYLYLAYVYDPVSKAYQESQSKVVKLEEEIPALGSVPNVEILKKKITEEEQHLKLTEVKLAEMIKARKVQDARTATEVMAEINGLFLKNQLIIVEIKQSQIITLEEENKAAAQTKKATTKKATPEKATTKKTTPEKTTPEDTSAKDAAGEGPNPLSDFQWQEFDLIFQGSYGGIATFLQDVRQIDYLVVWDKIHFEYDEKSQTFKVEMAILL